MELKIPPALTAFICGVGMWLIDETIRPEWSVADIPAIAYRMAFGIAIVIGGVAVFQFIKQRTTVDPHQPDKAAKLVDTGIYQITRNPMYLALLVALMAFGLKLGNGLSFLMIPAFIWYMNRFQIIPEENILREKFGKKYDCYRASVRRWI